MDEVRHNCGVVVSHTLHDNYNFIKSLQHRGRDSVGMAAIGKGKIDVIKWSGSVSNFDVEDLHKIFPANKFHTYMAHVRYITQGNKTRESLLNDAHPQVIGGTIENRGSHVIIRDCDMCMIHNGQVDVNNITGIKKESLTTTCDTEALLHFYKNFGEHHLLRKIPGSYTLAIADKRLSEVVIARDSFGIRPGVLGFKDGKYCAVSEDIALKENGGDFIEEITPGTLYYLNADGEFRKDQVTSPRVKHCFFEHNYISNVNSNVNNLSVRSIRSSLGEILAEEFVPNDADFVTFLPRCPEMAARSYAGATKLNFLPIFYKMRKERSFQGADANERKSSIQGNLHLIPGIEEKIRGKNCVIIDDSTIRGNNALHAYELLQRAGVGKKYLLNYTPQIGIVGRDGVPRGCLFGVDMPPEDNFLARRRTAEEINQYMKMEVYFISKNGMLKAFQRNGLSPSSLCTYCIGGCHPFGKSK